MSFPAFFGEAPTITLRDPLADFLGAAEDGVMEYRYEDAVRLAGHSCPTVAGSYLMGRAALTALYPTDTPERGNIIVHMSEPENEGTTGVMAQVFTLLTGAAADNGFHGIAGRYGRNALLHYADRANGMGAVRFQRKDNGKTVEVRLNVSGLRPSPELGALMRSALSDGATDAQKKAFGNAWQERVRDLLLNHADDDSVIQVTAV